MKSLRYLLLLGSLTVLLLAFLVTPALAFVDVADSPYRAAIEDLADRGILSGYDEQHFGPKDSITRQQFAKLIDRTLGLSVGQQDLCPFSDVSPVLGPDPCYPDHYVAVAAGNRITAGYKDGLFHPYEEISRAQVITMVVRGVRAVKPALLERLGPDPPPPPWALDPDHGTNASIADALGFLEGIPLDRLDRWAPMSRQEVAQLLHNALVGLLEHPSLSGVTWRMTRYDDGRGHLLSALGDTPVTVVFEMDGKAYGFGGVNVFFAGYELSGADGLAISGLAHTLRAGPLPLMEQESAYLEALETAARYTIVGDELTLWKADGNMAATYGPLVPN